MPQENGVHVSQEAGFVVVDLWRVKPGRQEELHTVLAEAGQHFRGIDGVLSVDYTRLVDDPDAYLVVFRYRDAQVRESFVSSDALKSTMTRLRELWDLESPIYQGVATGL
jgi:heme-degrading monooxygenase HmoA